MENIGFPERKNESSKISNNDVSENKKETFGFKSKQYPTQINELQSLEKDWLDRISSLKFRNVKDDFQTKIKRNISKIKMIPNVFVFADTR